MKNTATPQQTETPIPLTQREQTLVDTLSYVVEIAAELREKVTLKEEQLLAEFEFLEDLVLNWMKAKIGGEENQEIQYLSDDMIFTLGEIQELTQQRMQEQGIKESTPQGSLEEQKALQVLAGKLKAPQAQA